MAEAATTQAAATGGQRAALVCHMHMPAPAYKTPRPPCAASPAGGSSQQSMGSVDGADDTPTDGLSSAEPAKVRREGPPALCVPVRCRPAATWSGKQSESRLLGLNFAGCHGGGAGRPRPCRGGCRRGRGGRQATQGRAGGGVSELPSGDHLPESAKKRHADKGGMSAGCRCCCFRRGRRPPTEEHTPSTLLLYARRPNPTRALAFRLRIEILCMNTFLYHPVNDNEAAGGRLQWLCWYRARGRQRPRRQLSPLRSLSHRGSSIWEGQPAPTHRCFTSSSRPVLRGRRGAVAQHVSTSTPARSSLLPQPAPRPPPATHYLLMQVLSSPASPRHAHASDTSRPRQQSAYALL